MILTPADTEEMARELFLRICGIHFKEKGELDFSYGIPGVSRFRVNAYFQRQVWHCDSGCSFKNSDN